MRYRLKRDEPVADGVRRIGIGQIDRAVRMLDEDDRETGIHEARKCFKRLRALLDMSRPALKKGVYRRENRRFRDLGRMLAGQRDLHVMRQTLEKLDAHRDLSDAGSVPSAARNWLDGALADTRPVNGDDGIARARTALAEGRESFAALPVAADGIRPLMAGLRATYAGGRKAMKHAYRDGVDDEAFHEWRKFVQRHWRHLQLVRLAWPDGLRPRIALASELSGIIGEDHDLGVLAEFIARNKVILGPADEADILIGHARARQA
ncbi:MAG: CHAD domain-containing protein, partial [Dichotomicrobium sp.]